MRAPARRNAEMRLVTCCNTLPLPAVWYLIGRLQPMLLAMAPNKSLKSRLGFAHRIHYGAGWNKRRRAPVSIGMARQARRPTSNDDPFQGVYSAVLTLASS